MKTLTKLTIIGVAAALVLTGCLQAGNFNPFLGGTADAAGDATTEASLITGVNTDTSTQDPDGTPFTQSGVGGSVTSAADQSYTVRFENGIVDVNADGTVTGLTIYELLDTAGTGGEYARGAAIVYTAQMIPIGGGDSDLRLSFDLDGTTVSDEIEIAIDPASFTANGGAKQLNQDSDNVPGEADEDSVFLYVTVGGTPPVTAAGDERAPRAGVSYTNPGNPTATDLAFDVTGIATAGNYPDRFTAASLGGISVYSFNPDTLAWTLETTTPTYDDAGTLTLGLADQVTAREIYQIRYDRYNIRTSEAAYGFIQKAYTQQNNPARYTRTNLLVEGGATSYVTLHAPNTDDGGSGDDVRYIDVEFNGVGDVVLDTITPESVRFLHDENGGSAPAPVLIPYDYFILEDGTDGQNVIRFYFAPSFNPDSADDWDLFVYPSVLDDNGTPDDSADDLPVLNIFDQQAGVSDDSGTWNN